MENVTLLPHIGGVAVETHDGFERLCMENIEAVILNEKKPLTPVNRKFVESTRH
jgi:phosphoglycerate dehydrogenase-like enzyme